MFRRILIVCAGNLCRSPLAEALLRDRLATAGRTIELGSAGLIAAPGQPADTLTERVARLHGVDLSAHRSRPVEADMVRNADLVLVMEQEQRRHLLALSPLAAGKVYLLGHWTGGDIADPYLQDWPVYEQAYERISAAVDAWLPRLS